MDWIELNSSDQLDQLKEVSSKEVIVLFKHSTRCSISSMVLNRLERSWNSKEISAKPYKLDLISHRGLSSRIAEEFKVAHESPQVMMIKNGQVIYHNSHMGINYEDLKVQFENN